MSHRDFTQVGKYQIVELIGEGAMGAVYRAFDLVLQRPVAIKVMTDALAREPELHDRFLREAQAAGSLQHPNVITIYDFGEVDGHPFIAMELVEGADLATILERQEPLTLEAKLDIAIDVLAGLDYAHRRGIVHRDIKPGNIRITEEGRAKIMDFGIAHLSSSNLTKTGVMMGTPNYMAPEQVRGEKTSPATDIFAFGAVLFELLTGRRPFEGPTLHSTLFNIVSESAPTLRECSPGLPASLERIVQKALEKDPQNRFATALEMANELSVVRASLSGDPHSGTLSLRASIASTMAAQGKLRRPRRRVGAAWIGAAGAAIAAAIAAGWIAHTVARHESSATVRSSAPTSVATRVPTATPAAPPAASAPAASAPVASEIASAPPADSGAARAPTAAPSSSARRAATPKQPRHPPANPPDSTPALGREIESLRALQAAALQARSRAVAAGASAVQLAAGDSESAPVEALIAQGKLADAAARLTAASGLWLDVERAALAESSARARQSPGQSMARAAPPEPPTSPATRPAPTQPTANPVAEIGELIASYARAISSRDVAEVRRAYPGLTAEQEKGFEQFFQSVRSLHAGFTVSRLDVRGATAEAHVSGAYDFVGSDGKSQHQPITFRATLRRDGGAWRLMAVN